MTSLDTDPRVGERRTWVSKGIRVWAPYRQTLSGQQYIVCDVIVAAGHQAFVRSVKPVLGDAHFEAWRNVENLYDLHRTSHSLSQPVPAAAAQCTAHHRLSHSSSLTPLLVLCQKVAAPNPRRQHTMTYEALITEVAKKHGIPVKKAFQILSDVLGRVAGNALRGGKSMRLPFLGAISTRPVRSNGRRSDGTKWEVTEPRVKLALRTRITHPLKKQESAATGVSGVAA